ncbi:MAG: phosphatase PAP2 family protein [Thermoplasmatota archaeon]
MVYITYIGDYHILVPATIIVSILFLKINQIKSSLLFIFMMGAVVPASKIIKIIISRPRPSLNLISQGGYSFPSGHALSAFTFFIGLYIFSFEKIKYEHHILYLISLSILTLIVSFSRIILGVHYMTDLIGSFLLGGILIVFFSVLHQYITLNNVHD